MSKKYIDPTTTKVEISKLRNEGFTDKEIFTQLSEVYYDKDELAKLIKFYTSDEKLRLIKTDNNLLRVIFSVLMVFHLLYFFGNKFFPDLFTLYNNEPIMAYNSTLMLGFILYSLFKEMNVMTYFSINLYVAISFLVQFVFLSISEIGFELKLISFMFNFITLIVTIFYSTKIKSTLFPNLKFRDMFGVKKDMNGEYIFE